MDKKKLLEALHKIEEPVNMHFTSFQQIDAFRQDLAKLLRAIIESIG
jgi:hypothetical protein